MFGLLSSLDATKWKNSDKPPPADKETIEAGAYENYGVMDTEKRADCQKYVLVPDKGDPCKGFLYHYNSDPLRGGQRNHRGWSIRKLWSHGHRKESGLSEICSGPRQRRSLQGFLVPLQQ